MSKRVSVTATYRPCESGEVYQVTVRIDSIYPEAAAEECRKQAISGVQTMLHEARVEYGETTVTEEQT